MADFIYFTDEQKERVREVDLAAYLKRNGYKLKCSGSEYEWDSPQGKSDCPRKQVVSSV